MTYDANFLQKNHKNVEKRPYILKKCRSNVQIYCLFAILVVYTKKSCYLH